MFKVQSTGLFLCICMMREDLLLEKDLAGWAEL